MTVRSSSPSGRFHLFNTATNTAINTATKVTFWGATAVIGYAYVGFPLLTAARSRLRSVPVRRAPFEPNISLVVAAYNEAVAIEGKLDNTAALNYPKTKLQVILASDGSSDETVALAQRWLREHKDAGLRVEVLDLPRQGKNATLNSAVELADGEVLVFTDADVTLEPNALNLLLENFADPTVGCVSGDHNWQAQGAEGDGEKTYYRFERAQKTRQTRAKTMTSSYGAVYGVRRKLYTPLPAGVTDDFFISANSRTGATRAEQHRIILDPRALAHTPVAESADKEFQRKVRVISAGLRGVWLSRHLLDVRRYGFYSVQLFSHKVLRRVVAVPLAGLAIITPLLWRAGSIYRLAALGQVLVHGLAAAGWLLRGRKVGQHKVLSLPLYFDLVNLAVLKALREVARGARNDIWTPQR